MMRTAAWGGRDQGEEAARSPAQRGASRTQEAPTRLYGSQLRRIESTLNSLLEEVTSSAGVQRPASPVRFHSGQRQHSLGAAIAEVARRQKDLDEAGQRPITHEGLQRDIADLSTKLDDMQREQTGRSAEPPAFNLDKLHSEISGISKALHGLASRGSVAALEQAIRDLSRRIEASRSEGIREAALQPLEQLVGELRRSLANIDPRGVAEGIENEVQKLGIKLEGLDRAGVDRAAFQNLEQQMREIRDLLTATVARTPPPIEHIERQIEQLAESVGRQHAEDRTASAGAFYEASGSRLEQRLDAIVAKVEEAINETRDQSPYEALARRIDTLHNELAARITETRSGADTRALEDLVRGLADKLDRANGQVDSRAIETLEQQITELAQRLDTSNAGLSSLSSLEQTISALFSELEKTRRAAAEAAESSGSRVASPGNIEQELQILRALQDEADRRTATTLNAVRETLEKVVNRLGIVQGELSLRPRASNELLASGPAPVFSPPPQRELAVRGSGEGNLPGLKNLQIGADDLTRRESGKKNAMPPTAPALEDFLIEPGSGRPGRREETNGEIPRGRQVRTQEREAPATRADFIAAARRAAQTAQMEAVAAATQNQARTAAPSRSGAGLIGRTRNFIAQHKRPVFLSLAALFVAIGAYALLRTMVRSQPSISSADMPVVAVLVPQAVSPPAAAPLPTTAAALNPAPASAAPQSAPGVDPTPTGSIAEPSGATPMQADPNAAAQAGDAKAQFQLAANYAEGRHVPRDLAAAAQWYAKAAAQGLAPAEYRLATFYEKGLGVTRDLAQARSLYQRAAEQGNVRAMHNLAVLAANGGDDGRPDYATAAQWFKKAAEYGVRDSQYNLAVLLARGLGVPQNFVSAYAWFSIVAAQGDDDAAHKRDDVGARLNSSDLDAAKAIAAGFRPKTPDPAANDVQTSSGASSSAAPASTGNTQRAKVTLM
jgi:localization factor PodJL